VRGWPAWRVLSEPVTLEHKGGSPGDERDSADTGQPLSQCILTMDRNHTVTALFSP
jgi:hypothetical protein